LGGLAFAALVYVKQDYYQKSGWFTKHCYPVTLALLLGFSLLSLMHFNLIAMLGPGARVRSRFPFARPRRTMHTAGS
jgi:hypothetical protein